MIRETGKMKKIFLIINILLLTVSLSAKHYPDSVQQASKMEPNIAYGWNFEFGGGIGLGYYLYKQIGANFDVGYDHHVTNKVAFPAANAGIGINYYFVPWMGIGTGAQFSIYANKAVVTKPWTLTTTDSYGDNYTITSKPNGLAERQDIYMVEVPLALKFRARPGVCGFTATAGMKLGIPVTSKYKLNEGGSLENSVYYPRYDLTMHNIPGVIENTSIAGSSYNYVPSPLESGASVLRMINYAAYAEVGMLVRLHQRVDLAISAYANYYINDVMNVHGTTDLGFGTDQMTGKYPLPYNADYDGVLKTKEVDELHPWSVGLKVAIEVNANRTKAQRDYDRQQRKNKKQQPKEKPAEEKKPVPVEEPIIIEEPIDTTPFVPEEDPREKAKRQIQEIARKHDIDLCKEFCIPVPVYIHDTVYITIDRPKVNDPVAKELDEELKKAVIYFDLDKASPILEPEDILERLANVLKKHPDQKIHINGHACKLGKPDYNKRLAQRRANAVAERLRALGVPSSQLIIASFGAEVPFRYNGQHQLSKDRRVEIVPTERTTEIVKPGSRLAQIARRHYGEREFWVFIYEANRDKIKDPSNLPVGIELEIPDLSERFKNMTETQMLNEANKLKELYLKK